MHLPGYSPRRYDRLYRRLDANLGMDTATAKLASNMQKPDGLVILPIEKLPGAILHLMLRDIPGVETRTGHVRALMAV